jgi:hypothetical protein
MSCSPATLEIVDVQVTVKQPPPQKPAPSSFSLQLSSDPFIIEQILATQDQQLQQDQPIFTPQGHQLVSPFEQ